MLQKSIPYNLILEGHLYNIIVCTVLQLIPLMLQLPNDGI